MDGAGTSFRPMLKSGRHAFADHPDAEGSSDCESPNVAL